MTLDLAGACLKLERALRHLNELGDEMEALNRRGAGELAIAHEEIRPDPRGGTRHLFRAGNLVFPPALIGVILGDYVHNLRSALDHLAWELVKDGREPERTRERGATSIQFPIESVGRSKAPGRRTFETEVGRRLPGISGEQRDFVDSYQPYHRGPWHLGALAGLSNQDKHRVLTPAHLLATDIRRRHLSSRGGIRAWRVRLRPGQLVTNRTPILEVTTIRPSSVEVLTTLSSSVVFQERPGRYLGPEALEEIGEKVAEIIRVAATNWGRPEDAAVAQEWPELARPALGLDGGGDPPTRSPAHGARAPLWCCHPRPASATGHGRPGPSPRSSSRHRGPRPRG